MLIYEVTLEVDAELAEEYLQWLHEHVAEMLSLDCFESAKILRDCERPASFCVQYHLGGSADLRRYLDKYAPAMRAQGEARFGGRFRASRRILEPIAPSR